MDVETIGFIYFKVNMDVNHSDSLFFFFFAMLASIAEWIFITS